MSRSELAISTPTISFTKRTTPKQGICLHHIAGVTDNCLGTFDSRKVSTQYSVGASGVIRQYVDEEHISWATGTKLGNENFINIECSNSGGAPDWPVSDLVINKTIDLVAEIAKRRGLYPLIPGVNLRQHKQFVATYCAGQVGDELEIIAKEANRIIEANGVPEEIASVPTGAESYPLVHRGSTGDYVRIVQRIVVVTEDGIFGPDTERAVKAYQKANNLVADGIVGPATWKAILGSSTAKEPDKPVTSHKTKPVLRMGSHGEDVKKVQRIVGVSADGIFGVLTSAAVKAYQRAHNLVADGIVGVKTWSAMETPPTVSDSAQSAATSIMGKAVISAETMTAFVCTKNKDFNEEIARQFIAQGQKYGIRGDVAFCQSIHETGWFLYGGDVKDYQHNYAGIGAVGGSAKGAVFMTVAEGVKAQMQHLYAYCCEDALPTGEKLVDPRFNLVTRGIAPTWTDLNGRWAVPGATYGQSILKIYGELVSFKPTAQDRYK